jgi:hypothetical protein
MTPKICPAAPTLREAEEPAKNLYVVVEQHLVDKSKGGDTVPDVALTDLALSDVPLLKVPVRACPLPKVALPGVLLPDVPLPAVPPDCSIGWTEPVVALHLG